MPTNVVDALARVPMFSKLDRKHLEKLANDFSERTFAPGTAVVREGDEGGIGFFVIADGTASVSADGRDVSHLGPGDHFGATALIADHVWTATVTAETELHVYVMTMWNFRAVVQGDPEIAWSLVVELAHSVQGTSR